VKIKFNLNNLENYRQYLKITALTHRLLQERGYLDIRLPVLSPALIPESYLEIFKTDFIYFKKKRPLFLTPSPELFLKRLIAYGSGDCYSLGKSFRNSERSSNLHSFEFTMLEFYKVGADYLDIGDEILKLLRYLALNLNGKEEIVYQGNKFKFDRWEKFTVVEAFQRFAKISAEELFDEDLFIRAAGKKGYKVSGFNFEDIFGQIYVQEVEPQLGIRNRPTLIYDYPKKLAALAKLNKDGRTAQRFEFYIQGIELGDCYSELTDWREQAARFKTEAEKRRKNGKINHPIDWGFIKVLKHGLPDCAGVAIGFERLAMIFTNLTSIQDLKLVSIEEEL